MLIKRYFLLGILCISGGTIAMEDPTKEAQSSSSSKSELTSRAFRAAEMGKKGDLQSLLAAGVDINGVDDVGQTLLHAAVEADQEEIVEYLLKQKANPHIQDESGDTPLIAAVINQNPKMVRALLKYSKKSVNTKDSSGETALDFAYHWGNAEIIRLLKSAGARKGDGSR